MNVNLFKSFAVKNGDNMADVAKALNKSNVTLSNYLHGRKGVFSCVDINVLRKRWQLTNDECISIFLD